MLQGRWTWILGLIAVLAMLWLLPARPSWATSSQAPDRQTVPTRTPTEPPPPPDTDTPVPPPPATDTPEPPPQATDTPEPPPQATDTPAPGPTEGPTNTPVPGATATRVLPTSTRLPGVTTVATSVPGGATPTPCTAPGAQIAVGSRVVVGGTGGTGVSLRTSPSIVGQLLRVLQDGEALTIVGGPQNNDGFVWWQVRDAAGSEGWTVVNFLTVQCTPVATPSPTPTGTPAAAATSSATPTLTPTATPTPSVSAVASTPAATPSATPAGNTPTANDGGAMGWLLPVGIILVLAGLFWWRRRQQGSPEP